MAKTEAQKAADKKYDKGRAGKRTRAWAAIVYPESAPENWRQLIGELHMPALASPLHDQDVNADGTPKKPHHHVILIWENPASESVACAAFEQIGISAPPEMIRSVKAYARYLVHMDDHDKHRYEDGSVEEFGGASWSSLALDDAEETERILSEVEDFLDEQGILSYRMLCQYARAERPDWVHTIRTHTIHISHYLRSAEWEGKQE